jgi:hypothetical protein
MPWDKFWRSGTIQGDPPIFSSCPPSREQHGSIWNGWLITPRKDGGNRLVTENYYYLKQKKPAEKFWESSPFCARFHSPVRSHGISFKGTTSEGSLGPRVLGPVRSMVAVNLSLNVQFFLLPLWFKLLWTKVKTLEIPERGTAEKEREREREGGAGRRERHEEEGGRDRSSG